MNRRNPVFSQLTYDELEIARKATLDLGAGYPQISIPDWMRELAVEATRDYLTYSFSPAVSPSQVTTITDELLRSACRRFGISEDHSSNAFVTFSGSIALNRALASQLTPGQSVITTSPSVDIIPSIINEKDGVTAVFVRTRAPKFRVDITAIIEAIRDDTNCIILTSPENPTGDVLTAEDLQRLSAVAVTKGITVIIDHCFALIDPFKSGIPLLPSVAPKDLRWICVWDTGKTFGLNQEKLGFLFCSANLRDEVSSRINTLQFDVSRRQKLLFTRIFDESFVHDYKSSINELIARNVEQVEAACINLDFEPIRPVAGSMLLVDVTRTRQSSSDWCRKLLQIEGLGVLSGADFFHVKAQRKRESYIRLAMARDLTVVQEAVERITRVLS